MHDAEASVAEPRRVSRPALVAAAALTIALYFGFVVAWRSDKPAIISPPGSQIATAVRADLYALLASGFLKGHLYLDIEVPPELARAKNPYDPAQRPAVLYLHDSSIYQGRYYIYFGPAPAVLLFAPWRLITGHDLPTPYAVSTFVSLAYLGLLALFVSIVRTHYRSGSRWAEWAGVIALGGATMLIPLIRRPAVYETAISCGCACMAWGLYCAWRSRTAARPVAWATACGVLFGLAVAARPTFGAGSLAAVLLMSLDPITHRLRLRIDRRVLAAAAAGAVLVACLLAYNFARFGDVRQFGQDYQLSGITEGAAQHFSFRYVPPQAWFYLFAPLQLSAYFPFFRDVSLPYYPPGFAGHEYSFGIFANLPFTWFALAGVIAAWRGTNARGVLIAFAVGSVVALIPVLFWFGSCVRYQSEFTPALILLAACGVFEAERMAGARGWLVAHVAFALASVSAVVALLASVDMYNASEHIPPRGFNPIGRLLNQPVIAWQRARGVEHGPVELTLRLGLAPGQRDLMVGTTGPQGETEGVSIERAGPGRMRVIAQRTGPEPYEFTANVDAPADDTHRITVSMCSLYPIRPIELSTAIRPEDFRALKIWLRVAWNDRPILEQPVPLVTWRASRTQIAGANIPATGAWPVFNEVLSHRRLDLPASTRERTVGGVRLAVTLDATHVGRPFPLAVTGHHGRGNFLFVKVIAADTLQFGYDHWGKPVLLSPPLTLAPGGRHTIEFWMPSVLSADEASPLVVRVDGRPAWTAAVPFYPAGAEEIFIARNPLGGSSCEREFPGVTIEELRLPRL